MRERMPRGLSIGAPFDGGEDEKGRVWKHPLIAFLRIAGRPRPEEDGRKLWLFLITRVPSATIDVMLRYFARHRENVPELTRDDINELKAQVLPYLPKRRQRRVASPKLQTMLFPPDK